MNARNVVLMLGILLLATSLTPARASAPGGGGDLLLCGAICGASPCNTPCRTNTGVETFCAVYYGAPANDFDRDGVPNLSDNCWCAANPNQANCDGDSLGDACDSVDNSWYRVAIGSQACYVDVDNHVYKYTIEMYYGDTWRSGCTGAVCTKKYLNYDFDCSIGSDLNACCRQKAHWLPDCGGAWNTDQCGLPRCTF